MLSEGIYHVGVLARDRKRDTARGRELNMQAHVLFRKANQGQVILYQKKLKENQFQYWWKEVKNV